MFQTTNIVLVVLVDRPATVGSDPPVLRQAGVGVGLVDDLGDQLLSPVEGIRGSRTRDLGARYGVAGSVDDEKC